MSIDKPEGNAPAIIEYSKSPCKGSKSSTSILIATALSCLNDPRSYAVLKIGLLFAERSTVKSDPPIEFISALICELDTLQKSAV